MRSVTFWNGKQHKQKLNQHHNRQQLKSTSSSFCLSRIRGDLMRSYRQLDFVGGDIQMIDFPMWILGILKIFDISSFNYSSVPSMEGFLITGSAGMFTHPMRNNMTHCWLRDKKYSLLSIRIVNADVSSDIIIHILFHLILKDGFRDGPVIIIQCSARQLTRGERNWHSSLGAVICCIEFVG
jgi:hypothetical protein